MASTTVEIPGIPTGLTGLLFKLFDRGADTLLNPTGGGDALTEWTNAKGVYTATIDEAIAGNKRVVVTYSDGAPVWVGRIDILDTTATFYAVNEDGQTGVFATAAGVATAVRTELTTELGRIDVATSTRMATYTQPTGFLAGDFTRLDAAVSSRMATFALPTNFSALGINASGHISRVTLVDTLTTYTGNTPQTGDSFARLGVPANASVSADIAYVAARAESAANAASSAAEDAGEANDKLDTVGANVLVAAGNAANAATDASAANQNTTTILARLGTWAGSARNTILGAFQAMFRKDADATVPSDVNANLGSGAGTANNTTDSNEAIRDRGDAAWVTGSGGLDAVGIRTAIGMASANLDTQLGVIGANALAAAGSASNAAADASGALQTATAIYTRYNSMIETPGAGVYRFTEAALVNAPVPVIDAEEIDEILSENHGDGDWDAAGDIAFSGAFARTITVNDGATALSGALVRVTQGASTELRQTAANGQVSYSLDAGSYTVAITKSGYTFTPVTLTVSGAGSTTYSMVAVVISPPDEPDQTSAYLTTYDGQGSPEPNVTINFRLLAAQNAEAQSYDTEFTGQSDSNGLLVVSLRQDARYVAWRGTGAEVKFRTNDQSTFPLPAVLGRDA